MIKQPNYGWLFYKDYYEGEFIFQENSTRDKEVNSRLFRKKNDDILKAKFEKTSLEYFIQGEQHIELTSTYPGLVAGIGISHETGCQGEFKMGFFFDHSTGMPYIPASSVKGSLAEAFNHPAFIAFLLKNYVKLDEEIEKLEALVTALKTEIFEGDFSKSMYERDIFYDAIIVGGGANGKILERDFITPHRKQGPFKEPLPLQFLKIRSEVKIHCHFDLKDSRVLKPLTAQKKCDLFEYILWHTGLGAKTHLGYGKFKEASRNLFKLSKVKVLSEEVPPPAYTYQELRRNYNGSKKIEAKVVDNTDGQIKIQILLEGEVEEFSFKFAASQNILKGSHILLKISQPGNLQRKQKPVFGFGGLIKN